MFDQIAMMRLFFNIPDPVKSTLLFHVREPSSCDTRTLITKLSSISYRRALFEWGIRKYTLNRMSSIQIVQRVS